MSSDPMASLWAWRDKGDRNFYVDQACGDYVVGLCVADRALPHGWKCVAWGASETLGAAVDRAFRAWEQRVKEGK